MPESKNQRLIGLTVAIMLHRIIRTHVDDIELVNIINNVKPFYLKLFQFSYFLILANIAKIIQN